MSEKELQVQPKHEVRQGSESTKPEKQFVPAVDIFETEKAVTVVAEMPGVAKAGIEVSLEDGVLTLVGERHNGIEKGTPLLREYETGRYVRKFTVSETIDQEHVKATMVNGMLTLVLPKLPPVKPRRIEVKAG
ncbi:MAG: Hsp20/alpha crystallin family protein [Desulfobulbaceae bacterium]|nr:Hsp20/alpha crystallin family protein [Desulfobulbaceae bacterium]